MGPPASLAVPPSPRTAAQSGAPIVRVDRVSLAFDEKVVLREVSFSIQPGRTKIILGASGSGKSTILKLLLGLLTPDAGEIFIKGQPVHELDEAALMAVRADLGMVFQEGALFDSLSVAENVAFRLREDAAWTEDAIQARVDEILGFVRLRELADRMPSELSGGQRRRVAIARAMASKPALLMYDEATTGLDPVTALTVDEEMVKLRDLHEVTSIIVTHQLRDAFFVATHAAERVDGAIRIVAATPAKVAEAEFLLLREGRVAFEGSADALRASTDPYIRAFLS